MRGLEGYRKFEFFRGKVRFKQPRAHRLSIVEILFVANLKGIKKSSKVVDLGAGFGALSILTALRYQCQVWAIERDPIMLELLRYNVKVNNLEDRIHILDLDLRYIKEDLSPQIFDVVIANPPFYKGQATDNIYHHECDTSPGFSMVIRYMCFSRTPISPSAVGMFTELTSLEKCKPLGVTISTLIMAIKLYHPYTLSEKLIRKWLTATLTLVKNKLDINVVAR